MDKGTMLSTIKSNLRLDTSDYDLTIDDLINDVCSYCNLNHSCIPDDLESVVRRKVKGIMDYEAANGTGYIKDVSSIKEGDGTVTFAAGATKDAVYNWSSRDFVTLKRYRRLRGYVKPICNDV